MKRQQHHDEERYLTQIRNLVQQHKLMLEQQWSVWGPHYSPSHLPADIAYYTNHLNRIDTQIIALHRHKRRRKMWSQIMHLPEHLPFRLLRILLVLLIGMLLLIALADVYQKGIGVYPWSGSAPSIKTGTTAQPIVGTMDRIVAPTTVPVPNLATDPAGITGEVSLVVEKGIVANSIIGVRLRLEPYQDAPWMIAIPDGTPVWLLESTVDSAGVTWWRVNLDTGAEGYIKEEYLAPVR